MNPLRTSLSSVIKLPLTYPQLWICFIINLFSLSLFGFQVKQPYSERSKANIQSKKPLQLEPWTDPENQICLLILHSLLQSYHKGKRSYLPKHFGCWIEINVYMRRSASVCQQTTSLNKSFPQSRGTAIIVCSSETCIAVLLFDSKSQ